MGISGTGYSSKNTIVEDKHTRPYMGLVVLNGVVVLKAIVVMDAVVMNG